MREVRLTAIQPPNLEEGLGPRERKARNLEVAWDLMERAALDGADLICLPEQFPTSGCLREPSSYQELAETEEGALCRDLVAFARRRRTTLVAPVLGRYGTTLRNVAWVISRKAGLIGRYFKVHCTRGERDKGITPGDAWPVFEVDLMRLGVMICHDNSFPESARCLGVQGAEIVCWPHVQSGWGGVEWDVTLRSRAIDNGVYLVSSCPGVAAGEAWRPGMMVGRSGVVGPDGTLLVDAGRQAGQVSTIVDLDRALLKHDFSTAGVQDFSVSMMSDRRTDTYGPLTWGATTKNREGDE